CGGPSFPSLSCEGTSGVSHGPDRDLGGTTRPHFRPVAKALRCSFHSLEERTDRVRTKGPPTKDRQRRNQVRGRPHALIQNEVEFQSLALAIVDEQHRFGVLQRAQIKKKG